MRAFKVFVFLILVTAAIFAWRYITRPAPLWTERRAQLEALLIADAVTTDKPGWNNWAVRAFVPIRTIDAIGQQFVGTTFTTPLGGTDSNGSYEGTFKLTLDSFALTGRESWLESTLALAIAFVPDRAHHEWTNVTAHIVLRAMVVPQRRVGQTFYIRIVPTEIAPQLSWRKWRLEVPEESLAGQAIGAGAVLAFADRLLLPIALPESPELSTKIASRDRTTFPGGGWTDVVVDYAGINALLPLPFDVGVSTRQGLWLIGRQRGAPAFTPPLVKNGEGTADRIEQLRKQVATKLREWTVPSNVSIQASAATLRDVVKRLLPPGNPIALSIKTENAQGDIGKIENVRSEYVDNGSVRVRPANNTFANGVLTLTPGSAVLDSNSLTVPVSAQLASTASLNVHIKPTIAIGDGIGVTFDAQGSSAGSLDATLTAEIRSVAPGRSAVLQPALACKRVQIDITSEFELPPTQKHRVGIRRQQHVGGKRMEPGVLIDSLPLFASYPPPTPEQQRDSKSKVNWPAARLTFTFDPDRVEVGSSGLAVSASASVSRDSEPEDSETHQKRLAEIDMKRNELRNALRDAAPESQCKDPEEVALIADNIEVGPNNDAVRFVQKVTAMAVAAGDETAKRTKQWFTDAVANPTNPPPPPPSFGQAMVEQVTKQVGLPPPPSPPSPTRVDGNCIVKNVLGREIKVCP